MEKRYSHTEAISEFSEKIIDVNWKLEAHNAKLNLCKIDQPNSTEKNLMTIMLRLVQVLMGLGIREAGNLRQELFTYVLSQLERF